MMIIEEMTGLDRLSTALKWRERRSAQRLAAGIAGMGAAALLAALILDPQRDSLLTFVPYVILLATLIVLIAAPLLGLAVSASLVSREAAREDFRALRLKGTEPPEIASAYIRFAGFHLRHLWAAAAGLTVASALALASLFISGFMSAECVQLNCDQFTPTSMNIVRAIGLALLTIVGPAALIILPVCMAALHIGTYIGLRWRDYVQSIVTPLIGGAMGLVLLLGWVLYRWPTAGWIASGAAVIVLSMTSFYIIRVISPLLEKQIEKHLRQTSTAIDVRYPTG